MYFQFAPQVVLKEGAPLLLDSPEAQFRWTQSTPSLRKLFSKFQQGVEEETVFAEEDNEEWLLFELFLKKFLSQALLSCSVHVDHSPFLTLFPLFPPLHIERTVSLKGQPFQLSRFAWIRSEGEQMVLETPFAAIRLVIHTEQAACLLHALIQPKTEEQLSTHFPSLSSKTIREALSLLYSAKALSLCDEQEDPILGQWEFHDLLFHSRTRRGRHSNPYGGLYPFKGKFPPLPCLKCVPAATSIPLYSPELSKIDPVDFTFVLENRKSIRSHGKNPLTAEQLGEFLFRTVRIKELDLNGICETAKRPYPSGGALCEQEFYPLIRSCRGISPGLYHYHPQHHSLSKIKDPDAKTEQALQEASLSTQTPQLPQVLFLISSRFQRRSWKYASVAYATSLKNLGAIYQTLYLVATAMKLAPCAVGGGNADLFSNLIGSNYFEETSIGEFALGSSPEI